MSAWPTLVWTLHSVVAIFLLCNRFSQKAKWVWSSRAVTVLSDIWVSIWGTGSRTGDAYTPQSGPFLYSWKYQLYGTLYIFMQSTTKQNQNWRSLFSTETWSYIYVVRFCFVRSVNIRVQDETNTLWGPLLPFCTGGTGATSYFTSAGFGCAILFSALA